jgi:hypothetical protein
MIVPGGGLSLDGKKWLACRPDFFLPVRVLSRLFRRLFLKMLADAYAAGRLAFFAPWAKELPSPTSHSNRSLRPKSPLLGNGISRAKTKRPKRPWRFKDAGAETKSP